jgi:pimeloyl-ACP methyl ester carboxylesterase
MKNQSLWVRSAAKILITGTAKQELDLLTQTGDQVLALPTLSDTPVFVLSAAQVMKETTDAARFANEQRVDIARLYPGARQIWVDSGHAIPLEKPAAVVDAIRAALVEVKANR